MYYKLNYQDKYLIFNGILFIIVINVLFSLLIFNIFYESFIWNDLLFVIFLVFQIYFLLVVIREHFKYYLWIIILFISILWIFSYICLFKDFDSYKTLNNVLTNLFIFIGIELCSSYVVYHFIKYGKKGIVIEIDEKLIKKYHDKILSWAYSINQLNRIIFSHVTVSAGIYGESSYYLVKFEILNKIKLKIYLGKKNNDMIKFLNFLEDFSKRTNIPFIKIQKTGKYEEEIFDLKEYLRS